MSARSPREVYIHTDDEGHGDSPSTGFRRNTSFLLLKPSDVVTLGRGGIAWPTTYRPWGNLDRSISGRREVDIVAPGCDTRHL